MKINKKPIRRVTGYLKTPVALAVWILLWYIASEIIGMELLIPSPSAVTKAFAALAADKEFYVSCLSSLVKVLTGWAAGIIAGIILGTLTHLSSVMKAFFQPMLHIIKSTPVASFIVLALVLMSSKSVPVFTCALITAPVIWANVSEGLSAPDKRLLEMARVFNMSRKKKISHIYIPSALPYFSAAATTTMGLAWKAGIAAEVICSPKNTIGAGISDAKVYLETPSLFAWTITVIILSVILEKIIGRLLTSKKKANRN